MSFGFSAGDFLAAAVLIKNIISVLNKSSAIEYHGLSLELHGLQRALDEIEHLECDTELQPAVNAVKAAALMCQYRLDDFAGKLRKFESLAPGFDGGGRIRAWRTKLRWGFCMREEVQNLRAYLMGHVGSLNMRLASLNLRSTWSVARELTEQRVAETSTCDVLALDNKPWAQRLRNLAKVCLEPQIAQVLDLFHQIWALNVQILDVLTKQHTHPGSPDRQHTWFQEPVRFEDALGRVFPVPSEYNCGKIRAIILDQFSSGPGHDKVSGGEYEIFNNTNRRQMLSDTDLERLIPGTSMTMAFVIGIYEPFRGKCPRPGCGTNSFVVVAGGGRKCPVCNVWFDDSRTKLPRPFRIPSIEGVFKQIRSERRWFKNVMLCPSDFPTLSTSQDWVDRRSCIQIGLSPSQIVLDCGKADPGVRAASPAEKIIQIAAETSGISMEELEEMNTAGVNFDSLGLDSLAHLEIAFKLEEIGVDVTGLDKKVDMENFLTDLIGCWIAALHNQW